MLITVVYALAERQVVVEVDVPEGTTARNAAKESGLQQYFQTLDLSAVSLGVYGEHVTDDHILEEGDRLELYRDLLMDPMELRRKRAASDAASGSATGSATGSAQGSKKAGGKNRKS